LRDLAPAVKKLAIGGVVQHDQGLPTLQEALSEVDETVRSLATWKLEQGISKDEKGGKEAETWAKMALECRLTLDLDGSA
jgi:hypothetical protein